MRVLRRSRRLADAPRRVSLRLRLTGLVALGATVVLPFGALVLYLDLSDQVSRGLTAELEVRLAALPEEIGDVDAVSAQHPVVAQVVDRDGQVISPEGVPPLLTRSEVAVAGRGQLLVDRDVPELGQRARLLARPLPGAGSMIGVTANSTEPLERARSRLVAVLLLAGPALIGAVTFAAWELAGAALRPVERMSQRARTISMRAAGERLPEPVGEDEIARLGRTLNEMLERVEATVARERAFIDDASHELRTPLAVLRGELELLTGVQNDPAVVAAGLRSALEETDRLASLSDDLLTLARADAGQLDAGTGPTEVLDAARCARDRLGERGDLSIHVAGSEVTVPGDRASVQRILLNLLANAVAHARSEVRVEVSCSERSAHVIVADDGPGFPPALLPVAFDRFTRGDASRRRGGTGLGLAIVRSLVASLGGEVTAANGPPLGGACTEVRLPRSVR